ncbi:deacylase [Oceanidesulfovibrio indonesiensis]|uniref:Deacylase n=1 Tax=Oceanidesulfovibrio indonesiensis TaxID=54767 RepID=A0A7M3MGW0_9BACT|nr:M14 family metallopeptidase [Oceanidesulfovibrio indonesiensis]TVM18711.1 deacylase [Oceanidesulfovibrio indonesiensis]
MRLFSQLLILIVALGCAASVALSAPPACCAEEQAIDNLAFSLHQHEGDVDGPTLLVVGGIQGDEPGGFNAASLLVTHYKIKRGNVWIVPNLNFVSIIQQSRGVYGDLNRKFSFLGPSDPEYPVIEKIKSIITDERVDIVLNLHDGSGYYRHTYIDSMRNPRRWGQSVIIDQARIHAPFGNLQNLADRVSMRVNNHLYDPEHEYNVKNTKTRLGDTEMEKTLTYYAINEGKAAFGVEASKSFPTSLRTYYHLQVLEAFMDIMGIKYSRNFGLDVAEVERTIDADVAVALYDSRIFLDLRNVRSNLRYVPMKKNARLAFASTNPLVTVVGEGGNYDVFYGNRRVTNLHPQYFDYDAAPDTVSMNVDGRTVDVPMGRRVKVSDFFSVEPREGYRVNVIGFAQDGVVSECGIRIQQSDFMKHFSLDTDGDVFRVEIYREETNAFSGMVLVDFDATSPKPAPNPMPATLSPMRIISQGKHLPSASGVEDSSASR